MGDVEMRSALPVASAPPSHPDLQATVTDFSDYTEYFPSDLVRSLTLIEKLDGTYHDDAARVHELTTTFSLLPTLPTENRPDVATLRKQISEAVDHAMRCRSSAHAEASRIYEVAQRRRDQIISIKRKLQAQPEPPSRDPTPPPQPVSSPQSSRRRLTIEKTPRLTINVDGRHPATARPVATARDKQRNRRASTGAISPGASEPEYDSSSDESGSDIVAGTLMLKPHRIKISKSGRSRLPKAPRVRPPGVMGTNVHSSVAGISTSNALAKLTPPPPDAKVGSRHKPWHKLTEYEMALLRKQMKKNAIWTPSETMIRRELAKHGRGLENYLRARAAAEEKGEEFLDEDPVDPSKAILAPGEVRFQVTSEKEQQLINRGMKLNEAKKEKREKQAREQAREQAGLSGQAPPPTREQPEVSAREQVDRATASADTLDMNEVSQRILNIGQNISDLFKRDDASESVAVTPATAQKKKKDKSSKKRKRDDSLDSTAMENGTPKSGATNGPKKIKINPPATISSVPSTSENTEAAKSASERQSPAPNGLQPIAPKVVTTTTSVPLAPAGSSTPPVKNGKTTAPQTRQATPATVTTSATSPTEQPKKTPVPVPISTAALTRPRRISVAKPEPLSATASVKAGSVPVSPAFPEPVLAKSTVPQKSATPQPVSRPRSRGTGSTIAAAAAGKAASAEPPAKREPREVRELRRGSNISLPSSTFTADNANASRTTRRGKKPEPGLVVEKEEGSGKGKVSVGKRKGGLRGRSSKGATGKENKAEGLPYPGEALEDIDPDEPRYCLCGDVSWGTMICCSNDDCEREWFHLQCVGLEEDKMPGRRAKWYCPECRVALNVDEKGQPQPTPLVKKGR
ncbi:hypothetical protein NA57DRAFT_72660 [Rhizodiscina lignyota]|uniref:PHD-type domain-containing protein n=1 Tax=Rhizodiscina lignyota TaxID=1504668 RepID=A0A9P4M852_9PEZI|nr:hypothetical protein NA57DRAFT_72660 [Rhizodiscina lignyota]